MHSGNGKKWVRTVSAFVAFAVVCLGVFSVIIRLAPVLSTGNGAFSLFAAGFLFPDGRALAEGEGDDVSSLSPSASSDPSSGAESSQGETSAPSSQPDDVSSNTPTVGPAVSEIEPDPNRRSFPVVESQFGASGIQYNNFYVKNTNRNHSINIAEELSRRPDINIKKDGSPQVLIVHTHATESYEPYDSPDYDLRNTWRSTESGENMIAVGEALAQELREAGIGVVHDTTLHDYPSYNGSYERSAETIKGYLAQYPTIQVVLDVHRDAVQREEDLIVKPVAEIGGKKAAQLMIITGSDDGTMDIPHWQENLQFAAQLQNAIETDWPPLTRPIFFCYRKYNMDLTTGSLLLEVGTQANTLEEATYTARLVGRSLARLLNENRQPPDTPSQAPADSAAPSQASTPSAASTTPS